MSANLKNKIEIFILNDLSRIIFRKKNKQALKTELDNITNKLKQEISLNFFLVVKKEENGKLDEVLYLSESYFSITGLKKYLKDGLNIWSRYISTGTINDYIELIRETKKNEKIVFKTINFKIPKKKCKNLLLASKIIREGRDFKIIVELVVEKDNEKQIPCKLTDDIKINLSPQSISKAIFLKSPVSVVITNILGQILYVNPFFERLTSYTKEEVMFKNPRILSSDKNKKSLYDDLWDNLTTGKSWEGIFINKNKKGNIYYEKAIIFPYLSKSESQIKYIALKVNITREVIAEKKLRKEYSIYNQIISKSNIAYAIIDKNKHLIEFNQEFIVLFQLEKQESQKLRIEQLNFGQKEFFLNFVNRTIKIGKYSEIYFDTLRIRWVEVKGEKYEDNSIILITKDVTSEKKSEDRLIRKKNQLTNLINIVKIPIFSIYSDGKIINHNKQVVRLLGGRESVKNENLFDFFVTEGYSQDKKFIEKFNREIVEEETFFRTKDNVLLKVSVSTSFTIEDKTNKRVIFCVIRDITRSYEEKIILEKVVAKKTKELAAALEKEKELSALKTDFISKTSHEFRTPLATISLTSEILQKYKNRLTPKKFDEKLEKIIEQTKFMTSLLDDFLLVERISSNKIVFAPVETNIYQFVKKIVESLKEINPNFEINIFSEDKSLSTQIDEKLGGSIFQNLINNAIKYSKEIKKVDIVIRKFKKFVEIDITDYGVGIPDEFRKNLFSSFTRAQNVAAVEGTGLGLSIVKSAIDLHGGKIEFKSILNEGTTFKVYLPLLKK